MILFFGTLSGSLAVGLLAWTMVSALLERSSVRSALLWPLPSVSAGRLLRMLAALVSGWSQRRRFYERQDRLIEFFPQALGMVIQVLKTGQTLSQALDYLSHECPEPLRGEFSIVCAEMGLGASPEESLSRMSERYPGFSDFRRFLEAFKVTRRTGADLTHLLQMILVEMEGRSGILRKMEAMTAQARLSGLLMGLLPFFLGVVFFVLDPSLMLPLFTERSGWALLSLAGVLEALGFLWIRQLLRVEI